MDDTERYLGEAVALARANMEQGGRPFGAVVVKDGTVIATGVNEILASNDPTAHAELTALRVASQKLASPNLAGCVVYASGHPCPMCLAAMRLAGVSQVFYAQSNEDGEPYGLSTAALYAELAKPLAEQSMPIRHVRLATTGPGLYSEWKQRQSRSGA
ncbi:nucleoside deaminase [Kaistia adipata]|uniref:nucleoside deaminase n=1 Tax=Kaistia adipata TaxID=166954 RepID=UPI000419648F|nr:nucleoside deaminase [Kaistia adipata]